MMGVPYGEYLRLSEKSYSTIKHALKDDYASFENYVQYKAALSRWEKSQLEYPGRTEHLPPDVLRQAVEGYESDHPEWKGHFKEVQGLMDQMLLVGVLSGEHSVSDAVSIRNAFEDYAPLPRQLDEGGSGSGATGGASPTSGVYAARGSALEFMPLEDAVERRVRRSMDAYYENAKRTSILKATQTINKDKRLDYDTRKSISRLMLPLNLESKKVATLQVDEQRQIIAAAMNRMMAESEGLQVDGLSDPEVTQLLKQDGLEVLQPDDITLRMTGKDVYRSQSPNARNVVTTFSNGEVKYHQVTNQLLFDQFSTSRKMNEYLQWVSKFFGNTLPPWRRALTQNLGFAIKNIPRPLLALW